MKGLNDTFLKEKSIELNVASDLPISKGVGSSASYLVTISALFIVSNGNEGMKLVIMRLLVK